MKGDPLQTLKNLRKKSHKAEITCTKNFLIKSGTRTHVLLLGRPPKIFKKSEAEEATLVWQLVEASL